MSAQAYRAEVTARVERLIAEKVPTTALRVAMSTMPFSGGSALSAPNLGGIEDATATRLARWLDAVGTRMAEYVERVEQIEAERDRLVAQRNAMREFLGTAEEPRYSKPTYPKVDEEKNR